MPAPYKLQNDPPRWRGKKGPKGKQGLLFSGLHCLPGQRDLFATDGQSPPVTPGGAPEGQDQTKPT